MNSFFLELIPECLCSDWDSPVGGMGVVLRMQTFSVSLNS